MDDCRSGCAGTVSISETSIYHMLRRTTGDCSGTSLILRLPSLSPTLPRMGIPEICRRLSRLIYVGMEVIDITRDLTKTTSRPFIPRTSVF